MISARGTVTSTMSSPFDLPRNLAAVKAGDQEARAVLFDRFYGPVREIVHRQLQHDFRKNHRWILPLFSTGDIVQEVFLGVVHHQLDGFVGTDGTDEEAFVQYLTAIVKHRLVDAMRYHEASRRDVRRRVEQPTQDTTRAGAMGDAAAGDVTPSIAASIGEQLGVYNEVMDEMPQKQRRLLELRMEKEESFATIADVLGIASADAARQSFRLAKAKLLVRLRARGMQPPEESP
jgi:RNA polymerase sigma factor (sigma-70 family)